VLGPARKESWIPQSCRAFVRRALKSALRSHTSQEKVFGNCANQFPPGLPKPEIRRRRGGPAPSAGSGKIRTEERQLTVYALRHGGSSRAVRPWFVWLFADALKCRRWCYGATDGINSLSTLAVLSQSDRSNGHRKMPLFVKPCARPRERSHSTPSPQSGHDRVKRDAGRKRRALGLVYRPVYAASKAAP
jgi:hypothetical protein